MFKTKSQANTQKGLARITDPMRALMIAGAAALSVAVAVPTSAAAHDPDDDHEISFNGFSFDDDEDLLQQLIDMDADDIEEIRTEMADAREEIREAILEVEEAREEASETPGGGVIVKVALSAASATVSTATNIAFNRVEKKLKTAESDLHDQADEIGAEEVAETQLAINVIREEIGSLRVAISELIDAMKA
ncbi:MAG: hypothetical protein DHS20C05_14620 [Hyphococcus sp.]|nr:MAG: hypothetical protein DHS20C05_14620 [Marinicaulis sp.]